MEIDKGFENLGDIFATRVKVKKVKPPAHEWQDLALLIIKELNVPNFKRNSIFKVCKDNSKIAVERALNDTKELCQSGNRWAYFLKVIDNYQYGNKSTEAEILAAKKNYINKKVFKPRDSGQEGE